MQSIANISQRRLAWIALLTAASVLATGVFACAVPFAALAALAALDSESSEGLLLIGAVWLANQVVGFGFLGYPLEAQAFAWGVAIGLGALAAYFAARASVTALASQGSLAIALGTLPVAFLAYEAVLYAASLLLPGGEGAFSYRVIAYVGLVEVVAFIVLLIAHRVAAAAGFLAPNALEGNRLTALTSS